MKLDDKQKQLVLGLAECDMNTSETARKLYYTWHGIVYQIGKVKRKIGLNPRNFYDLCKLVEMAKDGESK